MPIRLILSIHISLKSSGGNGREIVQLFHQLWPAPEKIHLLVVHWDADETIKQANQKW